MKFAQEKRRLLGWLALLAPLPLPLNEPRPTGVVGWPYLLIWILVMVLFLRRVGQGSQSWLGARSLNLLGLAYLPFLALDLMTSGSSLLIRPMMHLAMFALAAKLFSLERERDKWHALLGIFFIFVTATATSTSLGIVVYLVAFMVLAASVLNRFSSLHMESFEEAPSVDDLGRLGKRLLPATVILMIPIFWLLPRFGTPFLFGDGQGTSITGTGFSDEVRLDGIGRIRTSSEVALRLDFAAPAPPRALVENLRLRGATYDQYQGDGWERTAGRRPVRSDEDGYLYLAADGSRSRAVVASAEVWLEPLDARAIILPNQTIRARSDYRVPVERNPAGALSFFRAPRSAVTYRVDLGAQDTQWSRPPAAKNAPTLDLTGVSDRIRTLARSVALEGSALERATRIESHLQSEYDYELELLGAEGDGAIERFLFERQSGHCEYFASAMVLLLRSEGIPARFVTGFLGSETSPLGYNIVRQSNAHAWVEAYLPGQGWRVFDPTPPAGRPTATSGSLMGLARQAYDWAVFSWDRYVVGFSTSEQRRIWSGALAWLRALFASEQADDPSELEGIVPTTAPGEAPAVSPGRRFGLEWWQSAVLLVLMGIAVLVLRRSRSDATRSYLEIRAAASKAGIEAAPSPLEFARQVARRVPEAEAPVREAIVLYMKDSFGPERLDIQDLGRCRRETREAVRRLRQSSSKRPSKRPAPNSARRSRR